PTPIITEAASIVHCSVDEDDHRNCLRCSLPSNRWSSMMITTAFSLFFHLRYRSPVSIEVAFFFLLQ
ncbi:unnamed protein product, partial [Ilex paraguariensis]